MHLAPWGAMPKPRDQEMQATIVRAGGYFIAMLVALVAAAKAIDGGFAFHMALFAGAALIAAVTTLRTADFDGSRIIDRSRYDDDVIRWG